MRKCWKDQQYNSPSSNLKLTGKNVNFSRRFWFFAFWMFFFRFQKKSGFGGILCPTKYGGNHASRWMRDLWSKGVSLISLIYSRVFWLFAFLVIFSVFQKNQVFWYSWSTLLWHRCYYPHRSRDALSPVCGIFSNYLSALKSSFTHFFNFLNTLLIILMQKNRY